MYAAVDSREVVITYSMLTSYLLTTYILFINLIIH